jgi:hypothetical protein
MNKVPEPGFCCLRSQSSRVLRTEIPDCTVADRLRWIADFLVLASKAIAIVACVQGLDYSPDLHRTAQQDLRAWASYLDEHPGIGADLELASVVEGRSGTDRGAVGDRANWGDQPGNILPTPIYGAIR